MNWRDQFSQEELEIIKRTERVLEEKEDIDLKGVDIYKEMLEQPLPHFTTSAYRAAVEFELIYGRMPSSTELRQLLKKGIR